MAQVIIFGAGRGADAAHRYLKADSEHEVCGFTVESQYLNTDSFNGLDLVDFAHLKDKYPPSEFKLFAPLGFDNLNKIRQAKYEAGKDLGYDFISYVHSGIPQIEPFNVGENCFILENNSINLDAKIGNNVVMWSGNQIGDSTVIGDHCWIASHVCIASNVVLEENCVVGLNASISHNTRIGRECFIGANAMIAKNTDPQGVYVVPNTEKLPMSSDKFMAIMRKNI